MKILKIIANGFKNCADDFEICFVPVARKNSEDKEYELQEIADGLFVFSTIGVVGKNASGKTSALELIKLCYEIVGNCRVGKKEYSLDVLDGVELTIFFYNEEDNAIYKYMTALEYDTYGDSVLLKQQSLASKKYYKSRLNSIFEEIDFASVIISNELPEDTSIVYNVTKKIEQKAMLYGSRDFGSSIYRPAFLLQKRMGSDESFLEKIVKIFDENISELEMVDENTFRLVYGGTEEYLSDKELYYWLSDGTTKGISLYISVVLSLVAGNDLIVDEIENHFHKTLVENIISLYKDKTINKKNATLIFSTHYCEILDMFNRRDNIYITRADEKVRIYNMYKDYDVRPELLTSKPFYNNVFKTAVNYEALMDLKKILR